MKAKGKYVRRVTYRLLGAALLGIAAAAVSANSTEQADPIAEPLPGESLYQLPVTLETATGDRRALATLRGRPLLVTMFYSRCSSVCPLLTAALQRIDAGVPATERQRLGVLMVSIDAANDSPTELTRFTDEHRIDASRWLVARTTPDGVRLLAAALSVRYRQLPDGTFSHSTVIAAVDSQGVVQGRSADILHPDAEFAQTLARLLRETSPAPRSEHRRRSTPDR